MGHNKKLAGGGFHHVCLKASDFETSYRFYVEGLGFEPKASWGEGDRRMALLDTGDGNYFELGAGGAGEPPQGSVIHIALRTDDCDKAIEAVRAAGAEVTVEPKNVDIASDPVLPVRIAFFKGPDGEVIELFQNELT